MELSVGVKPRRIVDKKSAYLESLQRHFATLLLSLKIDNGPATIRPFSQSG